MSYSVYLDALRKPFQKLCRLEFLNDDNSVAFALDNNYVAGYNTAHDTRAFIQSGELTVNLNNGQRRKATVTLANIDGAFDYAYNKIWFGRKVRLLMGLVLIDGTEFYLPQGVFYISNPDTNITPSLKTISFELVDKFAYLDGTGFGTLDTTYQVPMTVNNVAQNIFAVIRNILKLDKFNFPNQTNDISRMIDNVSPIFTTYYNGKKYTLPNGNLVNMLDVPYDISVSADGGTLANVINELSQAVAGVYGYDATGAFRFEASQEDINDIYKPILWNFDPDVQNLCSIRENINNTDVKNDVFVVGETLSNYEIWGRAQNFDPRSNTNINIIGDKIYREVRSTYTNAAQCVDLAKYYLKKKTILQKEITIESTQMFHLQENSLITVKRADKSGSPVEKHLITGFTLPLAEKGLMRINATSINDFPNLDISSSTNNT